MFKVLSHFALKGYVKVCGSMKEKETLGERIKGKAEQNYFLCLYCELFYTLDFLHSKQSFGQGTRFADKHPCDKLYIPEF